MLRIVYTSRLVKITERIKENFKVILLSSRHYLKITKMYKETVIIKEQLI